jgi:intron-binding protein aquarius
MATRIVSFAVVEVARPRVGEVKPAAVTAELVFDLSAFRRGDVRAEWDELKEHDVVFLLTVQPPDEKERAELEASGETGIAATAGLRWACLQRRHSIATLVFNASRPNNNPQLACSLHV